MKTDVKVVLAASGDTLINSNPPLPSPHLNIKQITSTTLNQTEEGACFDRHVQIHQTRFPLIENPRAPKIVLILELFFLF